MSGWFRRTHESERLLAEERVVVGATELLCEALERRHLSRAELAERLGVSPSEITQCLSGRRNLSLRKFAAMLHEMEFGVDARLIDRAASGGEVPLPSRRMNWPCERTYETTTRVVLRQVQGGLAS